MSLAISLTEKIIAVSIILQSIEFIQIRKTVGETGVWRWNTLEPEFNVFSKPIPFILGHLLRTPNFYYLILLRFFLAILLLGFSHPAIMIILLFSTALIALRWRGSFNGGSDFMLLIILSALCIAALFNDNEIIVKGSLWYITIQMCTSYFIGGIIKFKKKNWRSGQALLGFMNSTIFESGRLEKLCNENQVVTKAASWAIIVFECSFPLALLSSKICLFYIGVSFIFHIANFYVFGLNRFVFAWAAAYPALYYCSQK